MPTWFGIAPSTSNIGSMNVNSDDGFLLLEDGDFFVTEEGENLLIEDTLPIAWFGEAPDTAHIGEIE
jgi:hypothetical protein